MNPHHSELNTVLSELCIEREKSKLLQDTIIDLQKQLQENKEDRMFIQKATILLMKNKNFDEDTAFTLLRTEAMNQGKTIGNIAREFISIHKLIS